MEIVLDIDDARVLEMLLLTDGGLGTVWMGRGEKLPEGSKLLGVVASHGDVLLLVYSLQLGMETADHHVLESVALYLSPILYLVVRDVLYIAGHIVGSIGVGALASDARHQLVVLVRDVVLGCQLRNRVDFVISLLALCRVGQLAVALISASDFVEIRLFLGMVCGSELLGSLEHQMLQIVGKTGCFGRVVSGTCLHCDVCLQTRLFLVD